MLTDLQNWCRDLLNSPLRVAAYAFVLVATTLVIDGSIFQYWTLVREHKRSEQSLSQLERQTQELTQKIQHAKSLEFVEHQARDRLDLVNNDELVFVFSDDLALSQ